MPDRTKYIHEYSLARFGWCVFEIDAINRPISQIHMKYHSGPFGVEEAKKEAVWLNANPPDQENGCE